MNASVPPAAPSAPIRTRIAPSPTGDLHLGTARTALYSWAHARHHGGAFVLRIEDTDTARSTEASVEQIVEAMRWLGLDWDEGPIRQTARLARYHEVARRLLADGSAYRCWATPDELAAMRERQEARGEKTGYDGRWRPAPGKTLPAPPAGVRPAIRLAMPKEGVVRWDDLVKGPIEIANAEFDDLILVRPAAADDPDADALGMPTYNFAVAVDDLDMGITHVWRGDEHINNTPWQINVLRALGAAPPAFGHCPVILGDDGQKLSKRRGAVSVTAYRDAGYLPEAMLNYLARLGWSHGDDEVFDRADIVRWFDGTHLSKSPAQWDAAKLAWVNAQHLKRADDDRLAGLVAARLRALGVEPPPAPKLAAWCALVKDRCATLADIADWAALAARAPAIDPALRAEHLAGDAPRAALAALRARLAALAPGDWNAAALAAAMKATLAERALKMPQLAIPLRVALTGRAQTPSVDALLACFERDVVLERLDAIAAM